MDPVGSVILAVALAITGFMVIVATQQAAQGSIGANSLVGIRTRATTQSDRAWAAGHAAALSPVKVAVGVGCLLAVGGTAASFLPASTFQTATSLAFTGVGYLAFVVLLVRATFIANKAADQASSGQNGENR